MSAEREIYHLSRSLGSPLPEAGLPEQLHVTGWQLSNARHAHDLLVAAYQRGGGSVEPFEEWLDWFTTDPEFDPASCFLAWHAGELVGMALCWSSAFVKDLCVAEHFRRRGLASGLLALAMAHFRARGAASLELRSHADNPSDANQLYRKLGFIRLET